MQKVIKGGKLTMVNRMVVLTSNRGLQNGSQKFVEHPPILASKVKTYLTSIKNIRKQLLETYPGCKFSFEEVDEFGKLVEFKN